MSRAASDKANRDRVFEWAARHAHVVVALDPDLHTPGLAAMLVDGTPIWAGCPKSRKSSKGLTGITELVGSAERCSLNLLDALGYCEGRRVLLVVEGMRVRRQAGAETKNPQSLVDLSAAGGIVAGIFASALRVPSSGEVLVVEPHTWKGSVPKPIHQARTYDRLGWSYRQLKGYSRPSGVTLAGQDRFTPSDWKHVGDAVGLALWAVDRIKERDKWNRLRKHTP